MSQEDKLVWKILKSTRPLPSNESSSDSDDETISKFDFVNNFLRYKASFKRFKVSAEEVFNILNDLEKKLSIVDVDGVKMFFIFDTGASIISISETEANFLWKQGKLTKDDIVGTANFSDANGDISEGTIIILTTVKIGDRVLKNVEASVVHNLNAPLLFGQSALGKFGKISIDNNMGEITFE